MTIWSASGSARRPAGAAGRPPGDQGHRSDVGGARDGHLPATFSPARRLGLEDDASTVAGRRRRRRCTAGRPPGRPRPVARGLDQAGQDSGLPRACPASSPSSKRCSKASAKAESSPPGHQALAEIPQRDHVQELAQAPARPAVVGHRDHRREGPGVAAGGRSVTAVPWPPPMRPTAGSPRGHRSTSRWKTDTGWPCALKRSPSATASATERWRHRCTPARSQYDFPSRTKDGKIPVRSSSTLSRKSFVSGWERT